MPELLPLAVALFYAVGLFAFASWADGGANRQLKRRLRPPAYALALAVYCTSWTYYGAVGTAVADGWTYLAIYLGPILVFLFGKNLLRRFVDAVKADGANSISEFIGGRFGNSQSVAALVTILALLGTIPYLSLQLRSLSITYALMAGARPGPVLIAIAAIVLGVFAMIYGTRRYEASGRNDAILFAVGVESLIKITGLLVAGAGAALLLYAAPADIAQRGIGHLAANFAPFNIGVDFFVITLLSMAAILCLPRQFYVMVTEAQSGEDVTRARWSFIAYLVVTLAVILPIAGAGVALLPDGTRPDLFVLQLPLSQGGEMAALIIFLGGFSAATAMVLVETIALSTMISNDLVAPFLVRSNRFSGEGQLGRILLRTRRGAIAFVMAAAVGWALGVNDNERLASIGLIAFAAMAQFAPVLLLALAGPHQDALAAKAGLGVGMLLWVYTLAMPEVMDARILLQLHGTLLDPLALLGIDGLNPISHGTLWSLGGNLLAHGLVAMRRVKPVALPAFIREGRRQAGSVSTVGELRVLAARFVGPEAVEEAFAGSVASSTVDRSDRRKAERLIASVVGIPSARAFMSSALYGSNLTHDEVARILDDTGQSLRFSKGLLAATLENIDPGVSVIDRELKLVAWNQRYLDIFDYPPGMIRVGTPVDELIRYNAERGECGPGEVEAHVERRMAHMRRAQPHSFKRVRPDGRIIKTVGGPMPSGGYVMSFTDVTTEEEALAALERSKAELEIRVDRRTQELRAANEALAHADEEKTRFLAAASHDLLQPLHAARLFSAALARGLPEGQGILLDRLDGSIRSAETLLRALLDISRFDAGGVVPDVRPINVQAVLAELVETMAPLAREKGLELRLGPGEATVESDAGLLRSAVQNFLSNAIRYTRHGGIVVGVRRRGNRARIDVIDSGPGIPKNKRRLIFREFERLPDAPEGGIGLGLAIVDRTARLLGAEVSLNSVVGKGSRFSIALPMATGSASPIQTSPKSEAQLSTDALTVLIVDDDANNIQALGSWLGGLGHDVIAAATAEEALANRASFDVALVDFDLGAGMDGLELIERLRARVPDARYAMITASREQDYGARAAELAVPVIRKPVEPVELECWINAPDVRAAAE